MPPSPRGSICPVHPSIQKPIHLSSAVSRPGAGAGCALLLLLAKWGGPIRKAIMNYHPRGERWRVLTFLCPVRRTDGRTDDTDMTVQSGKRWIVFRVGLELQSFIIGWVLWPPLLLLNRIDTRDDGQGVGWRAYILHCIIMVRGHPISSSQKKVTVRPTFSWLAIKLGQVFVKHSPAGEISAAEDYILCCKWNGILAEQIFPQTTRWKCVIWRIFTLVAIVPHGRWRRIVPRWEYGWGKLNYAWSL